MPGCWPLLPFLFIIHIKFLGRYFELILMLPSKILLFTPLGKLAFIEEENINMLGLEAQSMSVFNESMPVSLAVTFLSQLWRHYIHQFSKLAVHQNYLMPFKTPRFGRYCVGPENLHF